MTFKEAYLKFSRDFTLLTIGLKILNVSSLIELVIKEYCETNIDSINKDSLLFRYGFNNYEEKGFKFHITLMRELSIENSGKECFYGFTILYDIEKIGEVESYFEKIDSKNNTDKWKSKLVNSNIVKKLNKIEFSQIRIELEKP